MGFTSYADLLAQLRDDLASGQWSLKSYSKGNHSVNYRSLPEFLDYVTWVETRAALEAGTIYGRTYLRPMGRDDRD